MICMSNTGWNVKSWYSEEWNKILAYGRQLNLSIRVSKSASTFSKITTNVRKPWLVVLVYKLCTNKDNNEVGPRSILLAILLAILPSILLNNQQYCWQYCQQYCWISNIADNVASNIVSNIDSNIGNNIADEQYSLQ